MEKKRGRGGAPKKDQSERKERIVRVLFNEEEFKKLMQRKESTTAPNLSEFIRTICLDKPMRMKPQLSSYQEDVLSLLVEMRSDMLRIGVNINQTSKRINSVTDYHDLQRDVTLMAGEMSKISQQMHAVVDAVSKDDRHVRVSLPVADGSPNY